MGHLRSRSLDTAHAPRQAVGHEVAPDQGDQERGCGGPEHAPADERDGLGHLFEAARVDGHPLRVLLGADRLRHESDVFALEAAEAGLHAPAAHRARGQRVGGRHGMLLRGVGPHVEVEAALVELASLRLLLPLPERHPRGRGVGEGAYLALETGLLGIPDAQAVERALIGAGHRLEILQPALLEARLGLGHDPEVDGAEGGRGDHEEEQRDLVADRPDRRHPSLKR